MVLSLDGVERVEQGWIAALGEHASYSEAVIVHFDPTLLPVKDLIRAHLHTHSSRSDHSFREKYRSAVYYFNPHEKEELERTLSELQELFEQPLITLVLPFSSFRASREKIVNYYFKDPNKEFCTRHIEPKLNLLVDQFPELVNPRALTILREDQVEERIDSLPLGYSKVRYRQRTYGVTKTVFDASRSAKVFGEELGGTDFVSFNFYRTTKGNKLRPCEMPVQKVLAFLKSMEILRSQ